MGFGGCQFHGKTEIDKDPNFGLKEDPFALGYSHIVRIEGDAGEVWQNWNFNPDGTLKEK